MKPFKTWEQRFLVNSSNWTSQEWDEKEYPSDNSHLKIYKNGDQSKY